MAIDHTPATTSDTRPVTITDQVRQWGELVAGDDSPLYRRLAAIIADDPDLMDIVAETRRNQPVALLFLAAVHFVVASQPDHSLAAWYPSIAGGPALDDDPATAFKALVAANRATIVDLVRTRSVQTNEVGRCSSLLPAIGIVAERSQRPVALIEIGCSLGLNLRFDDYHITYVGREASVLSGPPDAEVALECTVVDRMPPLPGSGIPITARVGLDLHPLVASDPEDAAWARALVWPDQPDRHRRLEAAIAVVSENPPNLVIGDALVDLEPLVESIPTSDAVCVVNSYMAYQLPASARAELDAVFSRLGRQREIWRVSNEWIHTDTPQLTLIRYDGSGDRHELLGRADKHGAWLDWKGPA